MDGIEAFVQHREVYPYRNVFAYTFMQGVVRRPDRQTCRTGAGVTGAFLFYRLNS